MMLSWALGGSRACRVFSLLRSGALSLSAASLCQGMPLVRAAVSSSPGIFPPNKHGQSKPGDRGFPDIVIPGSLGTEQEGFWKRAAQIRIYTCTQ